MKVFEKFFFGPPKWNSSDFEDPYQFAYKSTRSTDDAFAHVLNKIYAHLDLPELSIRLMCFQVLLIPFNPIFYVINC